MRSRIAAATTNIEMSPIEAGGSKQRLTNRMANATALQIIVQILVFFVSCRAARKNAEIPKLATSKPAPAFKYSALFVYSNPFCTYCQAIRSEKPTHNKAKGYSRKRAGFRSDNFSGWGACSCSMFGAAYGFMASLPRHERLDSPSRRDRATIRSRLIVGFGAILGSSERSLICQVDRPRPNRFLYFCVILAQSFRIVSDFFGDLVPNPSHFFEYWRSCHGVTFPRAIPLE